MPWQQQPGLAASTPQPLQNAGLSPGSSDGRVDFGLLSEELSAPK